VADSCIVLCIPLESENEVRLSAFLGNNGSADSDHLSHADAVRLRRSFSNRVMIDILVFHGGMYVLYASIFMI
jgi:Flp pilus assembly CpaE family ATPase